MTFKKGSFFATALLGFLGMASSVANAGTCTCTTVMTVNGTPCTEKTSGNSVTSCASSTKKLSCTVSGQEIKDATANCTYKS